MNSFDDREIHSFLDSAVTLTRSGYLNIIIIQSLSKFAQLGLDKRNAGLLTMINNSSEYWREANRKLCEMIYLSTVDRSTNAFFAYLKDYETRYLLLVNNNVKLLYQKTMKNFNSLETLKDENILQITTSTDTKPCYLALNIHQINDDFSITLDDYESFLRDIWKKLIYPLCVFEGLPITERWSIGFPLSSVNPIVGSLRFTVGLESERQLDLYADILAFTVFVINRLQDKKLFFEADEDIEQDEEKTFTLRKKFLAEKVGQYVALTPGRNQKHTVEFESSVERPSTLALHKWLRRVDLDNGNITFSEERPVSFSPYTPEWHNLDFMVVTNRGPKFITDPEISLILRKMIVAGCSTNFASKNEKPNSKIRFTDWGTYITLSSFSVHLLREYNFIYGPYTCNGQELYAVSINGEIKFCINRAYIADANIVIKQDTMDGSIVDISTSEKEYLLNQWDYEHNGATPAVPEVPRGDVSYRMQYIPKQPNIGFSLDPTDKLIIQIDKLFVRGRSISIYIRPINEKSFCFEVDCWKEKPDFVFARFLRVMTILYVFHNQQGIGLSPSDNNFTKFNIQFPRELDFNRIEKALKVNFAGAIDKVLRNKEALKKALEDYQTLVFEVNKMKKFCTQLENRGIKFDQVWLQDRVPERRIMSTALTKQDAKQIQGFFKEKIMEYINKIISGFDDNKIVKEFFIYAKQDIRNLSSYFGIDNIEFKGFKGFGLFEKCFLILGIDISQLPIQQTFVSRQRDLSDPWPRVNRSVGGAGVGAGEGGGGSGFTDRHPSRGSATSDAIQRRQEHAALGFRS